MFLTKKGLFGDLFLITKDLIFPMELYWYG